MKKKTRRLSKSEMYPIIELYKDSVVSQSEFCSGRNIAAHTFKYWVVKYGKTQAAQNKFVDVVIKSELEDRNRVKSSKAERMLRVHYPNGQLIEIPV